MRKAVKNVCEPTSIQLNPRIACPFIAPSFFFTGLPLRLSSEAAYHRFGSVFVVVLFGPQTAVRPPRMAVPEGKPSGEIKMSDTSNEGRTHSIYGIQNECHVCSNSETQKVYACIRDNWILHEYVKAMGNNRNGHYKVK